MDKYGASLPDEASGKKEGERSGFNPGVLVVRPSVLALRVILGTPWSERTPRPQGAATKLATSMMCLTTPQRNPLMRINGAIVTRYNLFNEDHRLTTYMTGPIGAEVWSKG